VRWLCEALGVSRSGFHAWLTRSPSARTRSDEVVGAQVKASFVGSDRTSGHGVTCSMSRSGDVWDNAAMESFFSSLKTERTARKVYRTRDQARADVFGYV
jgi:transposase InsO family protein